MKLHYWLIDNIDWWLTLFKFGKWIDYGKSHRRGEKFPLRWACSGHVPVLKFETSFNISGMDEKLRCLNSASKWIDYGKSRPIRVKNSSRMGRGLGHVIVFRMKQRSLNFANASKLARATPGLKIPPERVRCRLRERCLNFNPFNISGWWGGAVGQSGGVWAAMLRRITSLFFNDAWIYSEDAVLWHSVAGMSCFALNIIVDFGQINSVSGCPSLEKKFEDMFSRFDRIPACDS